MAIQFRSTPKRAPRDRSVDAILSKEDFEDAVAAVTMTLADIAKQTGVNRQYLSEFKSGDRNLRAEMRQTLRDFFEAKGVEFVAFDDPDVEDDWPDFEPSTRPTQSAAANAAIFPTPTFLTVVGESLPEVERKTAEAELNKVVQENNLRLSRAIAYGFIPGDLDSKSNAVDKELTQGLAGEALLRRVLAGIRAKATPELKIIMGLCYHTAQRIGDVLSIKLVDLTETGIAFTQEKTGARLVVAWTPELRKLIDDAKGMGGNVRGMHLLCYRGRPWRYHAIYQRWVDACKAAHVVDAHIHDLRAKSLTDATRQGINAMALAGHTSQAMTDHYVKQRTVPVVQSPKFGTGF